MRPDSMREGLVSAISARVFKNPPLSISQKRIELRFIYGGESVLPMQVPPYISIAARRHPTMPAVAGGPAHVRR